MRDLMGQITRRQHFVPQFLLNNFVMEASGCLHAYSIHDDRLLPPMKPARLLARNFFYDRDNEVEKILSTKVEAPAAPALREAMKPPYAVRDEHREHILRLIKVQMSRTPAAVADAMHLMDTGLRGLMREMISLNGWDPNEMDNIDIDFGDSTPYLGYITLQAWYEWPLLLDLEARILVNKTTTPFLISDHPAIAYNWHLKDAYLPMQCSPTVHGVQIFMPLGHGHLLCLNDAGTYEIGSGSADAVEITNPKDIEILNDLQVRNAESYIVAGSRLQASALPEYCQKRTKANLTHIHSGTSEPYAGADGSIRSLHYVWRRQSPLPQWLSFVSVRPDARQPPEAGQHRDPHTVRLHEQFMDEMRAKNPAS